MATTTSRTVELNIKLAGVQSLEELEQVTSEINSELKKVPINSKGFDEMSKLAKKANSQVKEIDSSLEGLTSTERAESVLKMGEGIAGAFQIAGAASLLFGEQTQAQVQKVIVTVGSMVAAIDGARKLTEAFSAKNIAGLKSIVVGFKESAIGARLFGTATRTAIAATGIGLLIIALGTVVAYWDEITAKLNINGAAMKQKAANEIAQNKAIVQSQDEIGTAIAKTKAIHEEYFKLTGQHMATDFGVYGDIKDIIKLTNDELENKIKIGEATKNQLFEEKVDLLDTAAKWYNYSDKKQKKIKDEINLIEQKNNLNSIELENNKQLLKLNQEILDKKNETIANNRDSIKANDDNTKSLENNLTILSSQEFKESEIYKANVKILQNKINILKLSGQLTIDEQDLLNSYEAQIKALEIKEQIRIREVNKHKEEIALELKSLKNQKEYNETLIDLQNNYSTIRTDREINLSNLETEAELTDTQLNNAIKYSAEYDKLTQKHIDNTIEQLSINKELSDLTTEELNKQNTAYKNQINNNSSLVSYYKTKLNTKLTDDERLQVLNKINDLEADSYSLGSQIIDNNNQINVSLNDSVNLQTKINKLVNTRDFEESKLIKKADKARLDAEKLQEKSIKNLSEKYSKEIQAGSQLVSQVFDLEIAQLERKSELEKRNLADIQAKKQEYADQDKSLNDLLADAEGQRYLDILAQIEANGEAKKANEAAEIESINKINKYEAKAAKARKTQAIIDATIQGALGVVEALPNIFLAALVGALTLASIATIASQPAPEPITLATGGIIKGNSYQGDKVDAKLNSGEMVLNTDQQANLFKQINTKPNVSNNYSSMIDYDLLANKIGDVFAANPQFVSVVEINNAQNKLQVVQNRASIVA